MKERFFDLRKIRKIAEYQFGKGVGEIFFPDDVEIVYSRTTGRIRQVLLDNKLLATLRPKDGLLSLTLEGAQRLSLMLAPQKSRIVIQDGVEKFIQEGRNVFAKHVVSADPEIRPEEEAIIMNQRNRILAVGRAILAGEEMLTFRKGVAVKVRKGILENMQKSERK